MGRKRFVWLVVFCVILVLACFGLFYVSTGGNALSRVIWNYFIPNIPDKKYSWQDFTDRGARKGISGFYAYGDYSGFKMWTLSGLKTFTHVPGTSVYQHEDVCAAIRMLDANANNESKSALAKKNITGDLAVWQNLIKKENLITVLRLEGGEHKNAIDKIWSYSGKYKVLNRLDAGSCK